MKLTPHWTAEIFPLNPADVDRLADDIAANGQRNPILVYKGEVLDGRTRLAACKKAGVEPNFVEYVPENGEPTDDELLSLSWSLNEARRHLSTSQRACAAAEIIERLPDEAKGKGANRRIQNGENPILKIRQRFGTVDKDGKVKAIDHKVVGQARTLIREAAELFAQVKAGKLSVDAAYGVHEELKNNTRAAADRAGLAALRKVSESLAEVVETGRKSMTAATDEADAIEEKRIQRERECGKVATGIFVALAGLGMAGEAMAEIKASPREIVDTRREHQRPDDRGRYKAAIELLTRFAKANDEAI
jgi:ParB-like chromosome segregation protein Spo0J